MRYDLGYREKSCMVDLETFRDNKGTACLVKRYVLPLVEDWFGGFLEPMWSMLCGWHLLIAVRAHCEAWVFSSYLFFA